MAVTLKDIAQRCGLAVSTVSNILNGNKSSYASQAVKEKVKAVAEELGYRKNYLSLSLKNKKTYSIGVCLDFIREETRQLFISDLTQRFNEKGFEISITEHRYDGPKAYEQIDGFIGRFKDAIILFSDLISGDQKDRERLLKLISGTDTRILCIGSEFKGLVPSLDVERAKAFNHCIEHLRETGHKRIVVSCRNIDDLRQEFAYLNDKDIVLFEGVKVAEDFWQQFDKLNDKQGIDALFFRTDSVAVPVMAECHRRGIKIPDEFSVIGFNNLPLAQYCHPPLSTCDIGFDRLAESAFDLLWQWIESDKIPENNFFKTFPVEFTARETVKKDSP